MLYQLSYAPGKLPMIPRLCAFALALLIAGSSVVRPVAASPNFFPIVEKSVLLIAQAPETNDMCPQNEPVKNGRCFSAVGTGFCVYSDPTKSTFVTDFHVVASENTGHLYSALVGILPAHVNKRYPVHVIKTQPASDLALVSIDVGNIPALTVSAGPPGPGADTLVVGFPRSQIEDLAQMMEVNDSKNVGQTVEGRIRPVAIAAVPFPGDVTLLYPNGVFVFQGRMEFGDSGAPVVSVGTDKPIVYGVARGAKGTDPGAVDLPRFQDNEATETEALLPFIDTKRAVIASTGDIEQHAASRTTHWPKACQAAFNTLSADYLSWLSAHGGIASMEKLVLDASYSKRQAEIKRVAQANNGREEAQLTRLASDVRSVQRVAAPDDTQTASDLLATVRSVTRTDAQVVAALVQRGSSYARPRTLGTPASINQKVYDAADKFNATFDCK